jgi:threonine dehydrogenase-like Zn-dependent dehydrogenase
MAKTYRAVVFHGPRNLVVEDRQFPDLKDWSENDAIIKVTYAGTPPSPVLRMWGC